MLPDGSVIIYVGMQNHGQGHETTLAQIAAHELGIDPAAISVRYGDTAIGPFGFGTFGSRSIVFAGGAVGKAPRALARKDPKIGAHLLQTDVAGTRIEDGVVHGPSGNVGFAEIAYAANGGQEHLPAGMEPLLDVTATYEPPRPAACSPTARTRWSSRSSPTPAWSKSSTTPCPRTAAP